MGNSRMPTLSQDGGFFGGDGEAEVIFRAAAISLSHGALQMSCDPGPPPSGYEPFEEWFNVGIFLIYTQFYDTDIWHVILAGRSDQ